MEVITALASNNKGIILITYLFIMQAYNYLNYLII
jgi:hypothetical protein